MEPVALDFDRGLSKCLLDLETYVSTEVQRLEAIIAELRLAAAATENRGSTGHASTESDTKIAGCASNAQAYGEFSALPQLGNGYAQGSPSSETEEPCRGELDVSEKSAQKPTLDLQKLKQRFTHLEMLEMSSVPQDHFKQSGLAQKVARSNTFDYVTLCLVVSNALWLAVDLDSNGKTFREADPLFQLMDTLFCLAFMAETCIRFVAFKDLRSAARHGWFVFDAALTALMVFELILGIADLTGIGFMAVFRMVRLLRLTRMSKVVRLVPELHTLVIGIIAGIRSAAMTGIVLMMITYGFALILRGLSIDTEAESTFSNVPSAIYTLMIQSMGPDNVEVMDLLCGSRWYLGMFFAFFLFLTAITIMNMLIGILCEVMTRVTSEVKDESSLRELTTKLQNILRTIDTNYDNKVSRKEFEAMLQREQAVSMLSSMNIDVWALIDEADHIFENRHGEERQLSFQDFLEVIMRYQANSAAAIRSISHLRKTLRTIMLELGATVRGIDKRLSSLETLATAAPESPKLDSKQVAEISNELAAKLLEKATMTASPAPAVCHAIPYSDARPEPKRGTALGCCSSNGSFDL